MCYTKGTKKEEDKTMAKAQRIEELRKKGMSKKALADYYKAQRVVDNMRTGTITHKSKKDYDRKASKKDLQKLVKSA